MIYFVRQGRYVKIGFTDNPKKRISTIQVSVPTKIEMMLLIEGGRKLEKELHDRFHKQRTNGEWFLIDEDIDNYLAEMEDFDLKWNYGFGDPIKNELMPVRRHRIDCCLTLEQLGEKLGVTRQGALRLEQSANRGTITLNKMREIAEVTDSYFEFRFVKKMT